jgi:delta 1-pyrroline-5-carboxylate dehydrogenase
MAEKLNSNVSDFIKTPLQHYIGGKWMPSGDGAVDNVINPSDGTVICQVAMASANEVDAAVNAAREAFPPGRVRPPINAACCCTVWRTVLKKMPVIWHSWNLWMWARRLSTAKHSTGRQNHR